MKIAVALSGGVDSAVVAKLLVDEGHEVIGLHLRLWADPTCDIKRENRCCDMDALNDARLVSAQLGIPFYVINAREEFKKEVVDYFLEEYKNLRTPNPCIKCNDKIKFDLLLKRAMQLGCDKLATGHYTRIINDNSRIKKLKVESEKYRTGLRLLAGVDEEKDQSYMLYRLSQKQLDKVMFPLGELSKREVRKLANEFDLPVKEKAESQEICFVSDRDFREFLKRYLPHELFTQGDIVNTKGEVVGTHEGLVNYTIGQRKGFILTNKDESRKPYYVVGFNKADNQLIIGEDKDIFSSKMTVENLSFINKPENRKLSVKIRYRHPAIKVKKLKFENEVATVEFAEPVRAITPGQSAVFYDGSEVVGGGIIS